MQNYAIHKNRPISPLEAERGRDYLCPECNGLVRARGGKLRQAHFFHIQKSKDCRLSQKGIIHLQLQYYIKKLFPQATIEKTFPSINRIADVSFDKFVFEIQYSPMSLEEAKARCQDYESCGCIPIWILHEHHYNKKILRPAEKFLRTKICYYSNMNEKGEGFIYDQLDEVLGRKRVYCSHLRKVHLQHQKRLPPYKWPKELEMRAKSWPLYHQGDFFDAALSGVPFPKPFKPKRKIYVTLLHMLLERSST